MSMHGYHKHNGLFECKPSLRVMDEDFVNLFLSDSLHFHHWHNYPLNVSVTMTSIHLLKIVMLDLMNNMVSCCNGQSNQVKLPKIGSVFTVKSWLGFPMSA